MRLPRLAIVRLTLTALWVIVLSACADEGAGGFTVLTGTWSGNWQEGAIPLSRSIVPLDHKEFGSLSITITEADDGTVSGMATLTPDICAALTLMDVPITVLQTENPLIFRYTSPNVTGVEVVEFTVPLIFDPMLGNYDATQCDPTWAGGIRLAKAT